MSKLPSKIKRPGTLRNDFILACIDQKIKNAQDKTISNQSNEQPQEAKLDLKKDVDHIIQSEVSDLKIESFLESITPKEKNSLMKTSISAIPTKLPTKRILSSPLNVALCESQISKPSIPTKVATLKLPTKISSTETSIQTNFSSALRAKSSIPVRSNVVLNPTTSTKSNPIQPTTKLKNQSNVQKTFYVRSNPSVRSRSQAFTARKPGSSISRRQISVSRVHPKDVKKQVPTKSNSKEASYHIEADKLLYELQIEYMEQENQKVQMEAIKQRSEQKEQELAELIITSQNELQLLEDEKQKEEKAIKDIEAKLNELQEERSSLTRSILDLNEQCKLESMNFEKMKEIIDTAEIKEKQISDLTSKSITRICDFMNEIKENEKKCFSDMSIHIKQLTKCHIMTLDIRWICRIYNKQGPSKANIKISIPELTMESLKSMEDIDDEEILNSESDFFEKPTTDGYQVVKHTESSKHDDVDEDKLLLPVSGSPHVWIHLENHGLLCCPFDQVILFDPTMKPHTLFITPWEELNLPIDTLKEKRYQMEFLIDLPEQEHVLEVTSRLMNDFLSNIPYPGNKVKPVAVAFICIGASSSRELTLWGSDTPRKVQFESFFDNDSDFPDKLNSNNSTKLKGVMEVIFTELQNHLENSEEIDWCFEAAFEKCEEFDLEPKLNPQQMNKENIELKEPSLDSLLETFEEMSGVNQLKGANNLSANCSLYLNQTNIYSSVEDSMPLLETPRNKDPLNQSTLNVQTASSPFSTVTNSTNAAEVTLPFQDFPNLQMLIKQVNKNKQSSSYYIRLYPKKYGPSAAYNILIVDIPLPNLDYDSSNISQINLSDISDKTTSEVFTELLIFSQNNKASKSKSSAAFANHKRSPKSKKFCESRATPILSNEFKTSAGLYMNFFNKMVDATRTNKVQEEQKVFRKGGCVTVLAHFDHPSDSKTDLFLMKQIMDAQQKRLKF